MPRTPHWFERRRNIENKKAEQMKDEEVYKICEEFIDTKLMKHDYYINISPLKKHIKEEEWGWFIVRVMQIYAELNWNILAISQPSWFGMKIYLKFIPNDG